MEKHTHNHALLSLQSQKSIYLSCFFLFNWLDRKKENRKVKVGQKHLHRLEWIEDLIKLSTTHCYCTMWLNIFWKKNTNFYAPSFSTKYFLSFNYVLKVIFFEKATKIWWHLPIMQQKSNKLGDLSYFCGLLRKYTVVQGVLYIYGAYSFRKDFTPLCISQNHIVQCDIYFGQFSKTVLQFTHKNLLTRQ